MSKKLKGGTSWYFSTSIMAQNSTTIEGETFWWETNSKKSRTMLEKIERGSLSLTRYCMMRGKTLFGSVPWSNRYNLKISRTFGRTILITSCVSKKTLCDFLLKFFKVSKESPCVEYRQFIQLVYYIVYHLYFVVYQSMMLFY